MKHPKVFGIRAPWSGDPGSGTGTKAHPRLYGIWWHVYRAVRVLRHRLGLHDWDRWGSRGVRCHWCGRTKPERAS